MYKPALYWNIFKLNYITYCLDNAFIKSDFDCIWVEDAHISSDAQSIQWTNKWVGMLFKVVVKVGSVVQFPLSSEELASPLTPRTVCPILRELSIELQEGRSLKLWTATWVCVITRWHYGRMSLTAFSLPPLQHDFKQCHCLTISSAADQSSQCRLTRAPRSVGRSQQSSRCKSTGLQKYGCTLRWAAR